MVGLGRAGEAPVGRAQRNFGSAGYPEAEYAHPASAASGRDQNYSQAAREFCNGMKQRPNQIVTAVLTRFPESQAFSRCGAAYFFGSSQKCKIQGIFGLRVRSVIHRFGGLLRGCA